MMALLDKPESPAVQNLLQEIAQHYPEVCFKTTPCNKSFVQIHNEPDFFRGDCDCSKSSTSDRCRHWYIHLK